MLPVMHHSTSLPRPRRRAVHLVVVLVVGVLLTGLTSCSLGRQAAEDEVEHRDIGSFYDVPDPLPAGEPGSIIKSERLLGAPDGAHAYRIMYRSTDLDGAPIAVSGVVVAPNGDGPKGGRPVVSWAHPTTGAYGGCAPSRGTDPFVLIEGLHELLDEGYVVTATDYSGMGADGPSSYLIGSTEGRNVLDAVRAAQAIDGAHAGSETLLWGHSQGGQAALFAAQMAPRYAPELDVKGVAVAAPAAELGALLDADIGDVSGVTIGSYAFDAFEHVYAADHPGLELTSVLTPEGAAIVPEVAPMCLLTQNKEIHAITGPLIGKFLAKDPVTTEPWASFLEENTPGNEKIAVPVLVAQGDKDQLVKPETTQKAVDKLCAAGDVVQYRTYEDTTHATIAYRTLPLLLPWLRDRLAGKPATDTCPG